MSERTDPSPEQDEPAGRSLRLDDQGRIEEDILCRACDYNLRGLHESADCPECSTPIARSARPDLLRFSDPNWLSRMSGGMLLIVIGLLAGIVLGAVMGGLVAILPIAGLPFGTTLAVAGTVAAATSLVTVAGVWLTTTPEPGRPEPDGHVTARRTARWCVMVQVVSAPLQMARAGQGGFGGGGGFGATPFLDLLTIVGMALGIVAMIGQIAGLVYLRRLALRIPARKLARSTKIVTWGYLSCQAAGTATGIAVLATMPAFAAAAPPPGLMIAAVAGCGVGIGILVFGIWALVLLFRYRAAFTLAAKQSGTTWDVIQVPRFH